MRRALALAAVVVAVLAPLSSSFAAAAPTPTPEPEDPIRVTVQQILPRWPRPEDAIVVSGVLTNTGSVPVTDLRVRLQVGDRIVTRGQLAQADDDRPPTRVRASAQPTLTQLNPGQRTPFQLRTTTAALGLGRLGAYPLDVVARGNAGGGQDNLGLTPTWLPYFSSFTPRPMRVAVLWPLVDAPHLGPDGHPLDNDLPALLSPSGRLGRLLDAARIAQVTSCEPAATLTKGGPDPRPVHCDPVQVTFALDPELLESVNAVASGSTPGAGPARTWLEALRSTGLAGRVLALPYADPDVTALARDPRTKDDIATASALGNDVVTQLLGVGPETAAAWPPPGAVSPAAADALALAGSRAFVLDPSAFEADPTAASRSIPDTHTLFATSATGAELTGLVVEPDLSDLLTKDTGYGDRVTEQRFLAGTAIIAAERPGVTRTLVLAPARRGAVSRAAGEMLRDLGRVPWLCPVPLSAVATSTESCPRESGPPAAPTDRGQVQADDRDALSSAYLRSVASDRDRATQLTDAVLSPSVDQRAPVATLKGLLRRAVARAESSVGRDDPSIDARAARLLHDEVARLTARVVVRGGHSLLTSSRGTLSVSIENTLTLPVQVSVRFTSKTATLTNAETALVTVEPGHAVQASVRARAQRSGQFVVFAQLVDRAGKTFGPETELIVRSTRFGRVALAVTLVAFAVLLGAAAIRVLRRVRTPRS